MCAHLRRSIYVGAIRRLWLGERAVQRLWLGEVKASCANINMMQ